MTESEARQKWCPFVRMSPQCAQGNRPGQHPNQSDTGCIASDCMAWRWYKDNRKECGHDEIDAPERGYCGLSGKP